MSRKGVEFDPAVKQQAHAKSGSGKDSVVHHVLPVREGRKRGVSDVMLRSGINARSLTREQHQKAHRMVEAGLYDTLAQALLALQPRLFKDE